MEQTGVRIDPTVLRDMSSRLAVEIDTLAERIYTDSGHRFNINSPKQLGEILFNQMGLPKPMKYGKGKVVSTAQDVLEELAENHPIAALVIEHRQLQKLKGTYLDALPQLIDSEGRIHTTFNQVGTATGRLSSTNPNLQNIPTRTAIGREIRAAFIAAPGNLLMSADYSQIELRLMAHFSQDPLLLDAYRTGKDIHTLTAAEVFGLDPETLDKETRARAKAVNFGIVYGISPFGLAAQLNIDQKIARTYIETYFDRLQRRPHLHRRHPGHRPPPPVPSPPTSAASARFQTSSPATPNMRGFAERTAVNTPLQGTAADLIKLANDRPRPQDHRTKSPLKNDPPGPRRTPLRRSPRRSRRAPVPRQAGDGKRSRISPSPIVADVGLGHNWRDIK